MPAESVLFLEDVPVRPVIAAIAGQTKRTVGARHFLIEGVKATNIARQNHRADCLERFGSHWKREPAGKALPDDLGAVDRPEELHDARLRVASGAGERVLRDGDARHAEVIYCE